MIRKEGSMAAATMNTPEDPVEPRVEALLIRSPEEATDAVRQILRQQFIVLEAESCAEASGVLANLDPPPMVLTSPNLPDGTWRDVLSLARKASEPVSVVVVSPVANIRLYIETVEAGAYDFITSSSSAPDISYVLRNAAESAISRRSRPMDVLSRKDTYSRERFSSPGPR
jgi:DNA-binding NtrC family response regulator